MKKETKKQREQRRMIWLARATAHFDTPRIRREALQIFDKANK